MENAPWLHYDPSTPLVAQTTFQKRNQSRNKHTKKILHCHCIHEVHNYLALMHCSQLRCFVAVFSRQYWATSTRQRGSSPATIGPLRASPPPGDTSTADLASSWSPHSQVQQPQAGPAAERAESPAPAVTSDCWTDHMCLTDSCLPLRCSSPSASDWRLCGILTWRF